MLRGKKGKTPTKGAKQIITENAATVSFYRNMSLAAGAGYNIFAALFYYEHISTLALTLNLFVLFIHVVCYQTMLFISRPRYSEVSMVLDPGLDLNMEGGMGEHLKDVVILSSITHIMAIISDFFWLMLLLVPIRAFWLLWTNILGPWFFQEAPVDQDIGEKKKRKMERKMNKHYYQ